MREFKLKNVIYIPHINAIGGVETYCYQMGKKYGKDYDITLFYKSGDSTMLKKIAENVRTIRWHDGDKVICDVFIFGYAHEILNNIEAKLYVQTFHADYINRHLNPCHDKRITHRFAVAENTAKGIRDHFDWAKDIQTMYNPYVPEKPRKVLNLISATRLTPEKGYKRMIQLADALDKAGIPFHWDIYTDDTRNTFNKSVAIMPQRLDILDFIAKADYLVQLSDTEGYSYSIVEALSVGTPIICTAFAVAEEQGIVNGKNGFILPMSMENLPIDAIYKGVKRVKTAPRESHYETILSPGKAEDAPEVEGEVTVEVVRTYLDVEMNRTLRALEQVTMRRERADYLEERGLVKVLE